MKAITLWPEWAWAITHLDKRVENRTWWHGLPAGTRLALHAGKHVGGRPGAIATSEGLTSVASMAWWEAGWEAEVTEARPGRVVTARFRQQPSGWIRAESIPTSAIVAVVTLGARAERPYRRGTPTGWAVPGDQHWWLDDVHVLPEPVPCTGHQGLWTVPDDIAAQVVAQLGPTGLEVPPCR